METIKFDSGVREFKLGTMGVLRFNPSDPNLYARFMESADMIRELETYMAQKAKETDQDDAGEALLKLLEEADRQMKKILSWVFGAGNDFEKLLGGVNLLAVAENGKRVISNLFAALEPVLVEGARLCAREQIDAAVEKAEARRTAQ